ncbi:hypothetical protein PP935_gp163 [Rhizobium phage RHph_N34]|uniref:Uncharacterized protein n=2 Tax=Trinifflemingvirus TaxID=3044848 RepID=A0A7S5REX6_9CAUD|nr:hypothetical protein PP935_gp163 [Rhizobium phage RHph_N34]YP_010661801.1 hypothetical protein PP936_gp163 [Rhizobium phage RHph_I1_9]QIG69733.1 hypothetical protein EVB81_164 [Rhizobium phage RHph_I46]QIG71014.1 hypothetical protein EVB92_164 [Rhizobium phage RHph_I9]QIG76353.1 hypothetical protein EVC25_164 [Rhizobium phage RHph_I34]QIG73600.1 hypothetical protein EVC04_163 [Rhizobium phage RHph_I1_9]QIG73938.1 hypothetical protein EVC06_163 [Rhizobium phage RHph_N34]
MPTPFTVEEQNGQFMNIDNCKSYASEENLIKAINKLGLCKELDRFIVVCNRKGRYTAIFSYQCERFANGGYIAFYSQYGFMCM